MARPIRANSGLVDTQRVLDTGGSKQKNTHQVTLEVGNKKEKLIKIPEKKAEYITAVKRFGYIPCNSNIYLLFDCIMYIE